MNAKLTAMLEHAIKNAEDAHVEMAATLRECNERFKKSQSKLNGALAAIQTVVSVDTATAEITPNERA